MREKVDVDIDIYGCGCVHLRVYLCACVVFVTMLAKLRSVHCIDASI